MNRFEEKLTDAVQVVMHSPLVTLQTDDGSALQLPFVVQVAPTV